MALASASVAMWQAAGAAAARAACATAATTAAAWYATRSGAIRGAHAASSISTKAWDTTRAVARFASGAFARLAARVVVWVGRAISGALRAARAAGAHVGRLATVVKVEAAATGRRRARDDCSGDHTWSERHHGAFAVERCSRCGAVKLSDRADTERGLTTHPFVSRRSFLLDSTAVAALERATHLDDPLD